MTISWPLSLPQYCREPVETTQEIAIRTSVAQGRPRVRKRFSKPVRTFTVALEPCTLAQKQTLDAFWRDDAAGGAISFDWFHPTENVSTVSMRFASSITWRQLGGLSTLYRAEFSLEVLP